VVADAADATSTRATPVTINGMSLRILEPP
jgi:hypothetical protein